MNCMFCFEFVGRACWCAMSRFWAVQCMSFSLWNILIEINVAYWDLWIRSCWLGCSQDVSFALRLNILFMFGVIGSLSLWRFSLRCRRVGAVVKNVSLSWWVRYLLLSLFPEPVSPKPPTTWRTHTYDSDSVQMIESILKVLHKVNLCDSDSVMC